ncbi:MAG: putative chaperone protein [Cellvibrionaceae bacterium]|jgi:hypothetical chaperone protein
MKVNMFSGFDFGTSNCAMGTVTNGNEVQLLSIDKGEVFMPSALYSLDRNLICESAALLMTDKKSQGDYIDQRTEQLASARRVRISENIPADGKVVFVGQEAYAQYLNFPSEGYFVKSIKSFLGSGGLHHKAVQLFEDIVTVMMLNIKQCAEQSLGQTINHTVIGRPVNFQGIDPIESNRRAIEILTIAAKRAGFKSVEFLFEPLAAGLDFEMGLTENETVLVVDVGGGTTDCSMVRMGPSYRDKTVRLDDVLGNSGSRVGGNDFDIQLAGNAFMPLFGLNSHFKGGGIIPNQVFWNAVRINNVAEQATFNSKQTGYNLQRYLVECEKPDLFSRFIQLRDDKKNHQLVRIAEKTKILLSEHTNCQADLSFFEEALTCSVTREEFSRAVGRNVSAMLKLIDEVMSQAACQPDLVYITGGAAKSQVIRYAVEQKLEGIKIIDGDHFGSVAKGLTVWAQRLFF